MKRFLLMLLVIGSVACGDMSDSEHEQGDVNLFSRAWGGLSSLWSGNDNPVVLTIEEVAEGVDPSDVTLEERDGSGSPHLPDYLNPERAPTWVPEVQTSVCVIGMQSAIKNKQYVECEGVPFAAGPACEPDSEPLSKQPGPKYLDRNYLYSVATLGTEAADFTTTALDSSAAGDITIAFQSQNDVAGSLQVAHFGTESQYNLQAAFGGTAAISCDGSTILVFNPALGRAQRWQVTKEQSGLKVYCDGVRDIGFKDEESSDAFITMSKNGLAYVLASDNYYTYRHPSVTKECTINVAKYVGTNERIRGIQMHDRGNHCSILTSTKLYLASLTNGGHLGFVDLKQLATAFALRRDAFCSVGMRNGAHAFFDGNSAMKTPTIAYSASKQTVRSIAMCPYAHIAVSGDKDGLQIWDMETNALLSTGAISGTVDQVEITSRGTGENEETIVVSLTKEGDLDAWIVEPYRDLGKRDRLFHSFHEEKTIQPAALSYLRKVDNNHIVAIQADDQRGVVDVRHINVGELPPKPTKKPNLSAVQLAMLKKSLPRDGEQLKAPPLPVKHGVLPAKYDQSSGWTPAPVPPKKGGCCTIV